MCRCGVSEACVIFTYSLIGVICSDIMEHYQYDFYISIGLMLFLTVLWFMMDTSLVYMAYKKGSIVSINILKDEHRYYKISSEAPVKDNHLNVNAKYKNSYAYIKKSDFK